MTVILGAVAYDPKVVNIWEGFKLYFERRGLSFDYILYSNYERQVEALIDGAIHVAWNSPLAWIRSRRLAQARGLTVRAIAMRDSDCDLASVIVVRSDARIRSVADLKNKIVAVGAIDSPQATLIPLAHLRRYGLSPGADFSVQHHDLLCGKHGDHIGGERQAAAALSSGQADAACMIESNYALFEIEGLLRSGTTRVLASTPRYDHCNLTAGPAADQLEHFRRLLLEMSYQDPEVRPLFDLEGLKAWREARLQGYGELEAAVDEFGFYDQNGNIISSDYPYR
ncbi:MAG: phosphate/phosphite/phosphonate ABC transporter substrate-binding protein [Candidatus Binataceae bacterium]